MFNSDEAGRSNFVTFVTDYPPLQDAYGRPNYFRLATNMAISATWLAERVLDFKWLPF